MFAVSTVQIEKLQRNYELTLKTTGENNGMNVLLPNMDRCVCVCIKTEPFQFTCHMTKIRLSTLLLLSLWNVLSMRVVDTFNNTHLLLLLLHSLILYSFAIFVDIYLSMYLFTYDRTRVQIKSYIL